MKKILMAMLLLLLCLTMVVSCGSEKKDNQDEPNPGDESGDTEKEHPLGQIVSLPYGGYEMTNVGDTSKVFGMAGVRDFVKDVAVKQFGVNEADFVDDKTLSELKLDSAKVKSLIQKCNEVLGSRVTSTDSDVEKLSTVGKLVERFTIYANKMNSVFTIDGFGSSLLTLYPVDGFKGVKAHYICFGDLADKRFAINGVSPGREQSTIQNRKNDRSEQYVFHLQKDGTYVIRTTYSDEIVLGIENGKVVNQKFDKNNKTQFWNLKKVDYPEDRYREYVSAKGNIFLRLPLDILTKSKTTDARMQMFADDIQTIYEDYIELTKYTPYPAIVVSAFETTEGMVMAGVSDGCNVITVRSDWYYEDIAELQIRWNAGKRDYNFCILHEMGHMFDSQRGWNFESEMEADLKAVYVLYKHQNDDRYGAWSAPSEAAASEAFDYNTINDIYNRLGSNMEQTYSFYGAAELFTRVVKKTGWDSLMKTFHYFQDNNITQAHLKPIERFETFLGKWSEYSGENLEVFIGPKAMAVLREKYNY